jgi:hypothetical protein
MHKDLEALKSLQYSILEKCFGVLDFSFPNLAKEASRDNLQAMGG